MIHIKILGIKPNLRYSVRRVVTSACQTLRKEFPDLEYSIKEIQDSQDIFTYTPVLAAPALVINEKLVYDLWIPSQEQVLGWLREALHNTAQNGPQDQEAIHEKKHPAHPDG